MLWGMPLSGGEYFEVGVLRDFSVLGTCVIILLLKSVLALDTLAFCVKKDNLHFTHVLEAGTIYFKYKVPARR